MSSTTKIPYVTRSWSPIRGCTPVSAGCKRCWAARDAIRRAKPGEQCHGLVKSTSSGPRWTGEVRLISKDLDAMMRWRKPRRVAVCFGGDLFYERVPDEWICHVFAVMALAPEHCSLVLTKRAERMRAWCELKAWPLPNVWPGVSVEDRKALARIDELRATPAAHRWLSLEPLLEDLGEIGLTGIDWVVAGGESGPGASPCDLAWLRSVVAQCRAAGVPCYVKQVGARPTGEWLSGRHEEDCARCHACLTLDPTEPHRLRDHKGADLEEWPEDLRVQEVPW